MIKKLLTLGLLCFTVAASAATPKWTPQSFINNGTFLALSNNTTFNFAGPLLSSNLVFWSYNNATNINAGTTNGNIGAILGKPALVPADVYPDANGDIQANASVYISLGLTNNWPLPANMTPIFSNVSNTNYNSIFTGVTTNILTITLVALADGVNYDLPITGFGAKSFVWNFTATNLAANTLITLSTNLPSTFLQGTPKVGVYSIVVGNAPTGGGAGVTVDAFGISQIAP